MLEGSTSVPELSSRLPITRQAVAKHIAVLDHAGLLERAPASGREVRYRLRSGAVEPAAAWMRRAQERWDTRLGRLKDQVERERAGEVAYSTDPLASDHEETA
jgi:predicted transcriptional regulator